MKKKQVILGIGSDLGDKALHLKTAIREFSEKGFRIIACSSVYESEPWGFESDTTFFNAVCIVETNLNAEHLLIELKAIEKKIGRKQKTEKNYSSREIDIDILFFGEEVINNPMLQVPHPRIAQRKFVLEPLHEILPMFQHPLLNKSIHVLLKSCSDHTKVKIVHNTLLINH